MEREHPGKEHRACGRKVDATAGEETGVGASPCGERPAGALRSGAGASEPRGCGGLPRALETRSCDPGSEEMAELGLTP